MTTLNFKVIDLDFPVGSKNKTATLVTTERDALLVDAVAPIARTARPCRRREPQKSSAAGRPT